MKMRKRLIVKSSYTLYTQASCLLSEIVLTDGITPIILVKRLNKNKEN